MTTSSYVYTYEQAFFTLTAMFDTYTTATDPPDRFGFQDVFKEGEFDRAVFVSYDGAGPGLPGERKMLDPVPGVNYLTGDPMTWAPFYCGAQMALPNELVHLFAKFGAADANVAGQLATYTDFTKAMKYNGWRRLDLECLDILINGTTTDSRHVGRRSEPLFSTSHALLGGGTASNLSVNLTLNETNLNFVMNALKSQKDENGAPIARKGKYKLVHGVALDSKAWTLLNTKKKTGSAENDESYIYSMRNEIEDISWDEIDPSYNGWWLLGPKHGLRAKWMEKPHYTKQSELKNNSIAYAMNMGARAFWDGWRDAFMVAPS
jgi:hypothetical protein